MRNFKLKFLSVLLAVIMFVTFVPNSVYAVIADAFNTDETYNNSTIGSNDSEEEAYALGEDISKRTENAKYIRMSDGSYYLAMYNNAVHYQDENGDWQDIDNTLSGSSAADSDDVAGVATSKGKHTVKFANNSNSSKLVAIKQYKYKISFNLVGANKSKAATVTNPTEHAEDATELQKITVLNKMISSVKYADILDGVDLEYVVSGNDVKENIIVKEKNDEYVYQFDMNLNKLVAEVQDDGTIALKDDKSGEVVYTIAMPYMFDANGEQSNAVTYTLEQIKNKEYRITVTADAEWINAEGRAFPVTIDPSVEAGKSVAIDTYVRQSIPTTNYKNMVASLVGFENTNACYYYWKLENINLPSVPENSVITNATISLYQTFLNSGSSIKVGVYEVNSSWTDSITWNTKPSASSTMIDYQQVSSSTTNDWSTWDITRVVKNWYYGDINNGIMFRMIPNTGTSGVTSTVTFATANRSGYEPTFTVTYRNAVGLEGYYTYHNQSIGRAGTGYINDYTSDLTLVRNDLTADSEITPFSLAHIYNDAYSASYFTSTGTDINTVAFSNMSFGRGWKLNVQETIVQKVLGSTTYYVYNDSDGTEHYFKSENGTYIDEDGLGLTLTVSGTTYTLEDKQGNQKIFSSGILTKIRDENGNAINMVYENSQLKRITRKNNESSSNAVEETLASLTYNGSLLQSITDAYGRITTFSYDSNNCLIKITSPDSTTVEYTYDSSDNYRLTSAKDNEAQYAVTYTMGYDSTQSEYVWKRIRNIQEYYLNGTTKNYGKGIYLENTIGIFATYTEYKPSFILDDISTTYVFDYRGRSVTVYSHDENGKVYGANTSGYVESGVTKQNNHISSQSVVGVLVQNLFSNSSFESGTTDWSTSDTTVFAVNAQPRTGSRALRFAAAGSEKYVYQTYSTEGNDGKYTASAYVDVSRVTSFSGGIYFKVYEGSISASNLVAMGTALNANMTSSLDDKWQRVSVTFDADMYTTYVICLCVNGTNAYVYADDMQLEYSAAPSAYNLMGDIYTWTLPGYSTITHIPNIPELIYAIPLSIVEGNSNTSIGATTTIPVNKSSNTTFLLSAWGQIATTTGKYEEGDVRAAAIQAVIHYSDGTTEATTIPFNTEIRSQRQFVQGIIVPEKSSLTIEKIVVNAVVQNLYGGAYIYDIALVEDAAQTYSYDSEGNLVASNQTDTTSVTSRYDSNDNLIEKSQGNTTYNYTYDTTYPHRVTRVETPNTYMDFEYDAYGNVTGMYITGGNPISFLAENTYTNNGNKLSSQTDINRITTTYGYNNKGLLSSITNANGVSTTYTYNQYNDRQVSAAVASLVSVNYEYLKGALSKITRGDGQTYSFTYDGFGNTTAVKVGTTTLVTYTYDSYNGNLLTTTYGNSVTLTNIYDELDRIIAIKIGGVEKYRYSYNGNGKLYSVEDVDNGITVCYNYDSLDRLISTWQTDGYDTAYTYYTYDAKGRVTEYNCKMETWGISLGHNYAYNYDSTDNLLNSMTVNNDTISYTYDDVERLTNKAVSATGINLQQLYYYNDGEYMINQISALHVKLNGVTVKTFGYTYDDIGDITAITSGGTTESVYTYDAQGQLTSETIASRNLKYVYTYDNYGNIKTVTKKSISPEATIETYTYTYGNSQWRDRLTAFKGKTFTYDNIGNPTTYYNGGTDADKYTFTWQNGRELASSTKNGYTTTYKYSADGLRISKSGYDFYYSDGKLVRQMWADGEQLDFLYDESGLPYAMQYYSTMYYYVKNLQGDVVAIADANGNIVVNYSYDVWGNILSITDGSGNDISDNIWHIGNLNPIRYRSYYYDGETGFYYLQSRYYDPTIRRFINADGYLNANGDILGFNMYAYCGNNPVMGYDPTGTTTYGFSLGANVTAFLGVSISIGIFWDDKGNCEWQWSYSVPGVDDTVTVGCLDAGVGLSFQCTNRDTIYDLYGSASYAGASGGPWWYIGGDVISFSDASEDGNIDGFQLTGGIGLGLDVHVVESNTKPINSSSQSSENIPRGIGFAAKSNNIFRNSILFKKK